MRKRGKEVKGKKTKEKPKCKIYIFCEGTTEEIYLRHFENRTYNVEIIPVDSKHTDVYEFLLPRQKNAVKRAKILHKSQQEVYETVHSHECNPYTDIFEFIDYMEEIKERNG